MGFLDKLINDAAEELKKKAEEAKNQMIQNMKNQVDGIIGICGALPWNRGASSITSPAICH